jgi:hypothetical protein
VDKLYKFVRKKGKYVLGKAKIRQWLETQETFGFHRQIKRKFSRRKVIVPFIEYQWDADTAVMKSFTKDNDGYGYLLLAIDDLFIQGLYSLVASQFLWLTSALKYSVQSVGLFFALCSFEGKRSHIMRENVNGQ